MLVSGIELGYWFLQWKKVIESVRDFGIVCGRDTLCRDFRDGGVSGIEIGSLFEQLPSFPRIFTRDSEAVFIVEGLSLPNCSVVEVPMSFVIS